MRNSLLFCNIGWMEYYCGITKKDLIVGGGKHVALTHRGSEVCNFLPHHGKCFGFVQPPETKKTAQSSGAKIQIERLGASRGDDDVDNIDVVITALRPGGGTFIVGWYKSARVFRMRQDLANPSKTHRDNKVKSFRFEAQSENVTLLPVDKRTVLVPRGNGGMGTSNIWYADVNANKAWITRVRRLISSGIDAALPKGSKKLRGAPDQERKVLIETAAILKTRQFFEPEYNVKTVENENLGWDLEATNGDIRLLIEVKGRSVNMIHAELTPNEYAAFKKNKADYRLCIVTNCLSIPRLYVFKFNFSIERWICESGNDKWILDITEKTGAVVSSSKCQ